MAVTLGALGGKKRWKGKTKADKKEFIAMLNRKRLEKLSKIRAEKAKLDKKVTHSSID